MRVSKAMAKKLGIVGGRLRLPAQPTAQPPDSLSGGVTFYVDIPVRVLSEANVRCHWGARHRRFKAQSDAVWDALLAGRWGFPHAFNDAKYVVTLTRLGGKRLDTDNLAGAFKGCRDAVSEFLAVDDGDESRVEWHYSQSPGGAVGIRVTIAAEWSALRGGAP